MLFYQKMEEAFSTKLCDKVYILEIFNIHHFDELSCSAVTDRPGYYFMSHHLLKFLISLPQSLIFMQTVLFCDHVLSATISFFHSRQFCYFMLIKIDLAIISEMISISHFCFFIFFFFFSYRFSVIDDFKWFWMKRYCRNNHLMLMLLKTPFFFLHFSYCTLMRFLMVLSVILLIMRII